jgi:2-polyprenyl-3-methyl-5-hydroxy-6-metoxy-1,4-benzoquinol methylase
MPQYQSFPGASRTLDKLKALGLPDLSGKSFVDVACNDGFLCGYASHHGALRSVGMDHSEQFIERAPSRFPDCHMTYTHSCCESSIMSAAEWAASMAWR